MGRHQNRPMIDAGEATSSACAALCLGNATAMSPAEIGRLRSRSEALTERVSHCPIEPPDILFDGKLHALSIRIGRQTLSTTEHAAVTASSGSSVALRGSRNGGPRGDCRELYPVEVAPDQWSVSRTKMIRSLFGFSLAWARSPRPRISGQKKTRLFSI